MGWPPRRHRTTAPPWEPPPFFAHAHAPNRDRRPGNRPQAQVPGRGVGQQQSAPNMAPDILSYGRRPPPPSDLGRQSPLHRPPVTTSRCQHPAVITTWPAPWGGDNQGEADATLGLPWPLALTEATTTGAQRTGPPLPRPPMGTGLGLSANPCCHTARPLPLYPSSGPWRQRRGRDSVTPLVKMPRPRNFFKKSFPENTPRVMGPAPKNYQTDF